MKFFSDLLSSGPFFFARKTLNAHLLENKGKETRHAQRMARALSLSVPVRLAFLFLRTKDASNTYLFPAMFGVDLRGNAFGNGFFLWTPGRAGQGTRAYDASLWSRGVLVWSQGYLPVLLLLLLVLISMGGRDWVTVANMSLSGHFVI